VTLDDLSLTGDDDIREAFVEEQLVEHMEEIVGMKLPLNTEIYRSNK
jgi:hypothetical protein